MARFFAGRDFTVASRSAADGLRLEATDGPFAAGAGRLVSGTTLALTMAMAGRQAYCDELTGPGAPSCAIAARPPEPQARTRTVADTAHTTDVPFAEPVTRLPRSGIPIRGTAARPPTSP